MTLIGARLDERELAKLAEGGIRHCTFYRDAAAPEAEALRYLDKVVALTEKFRDH